LPARAKNAGEGDHSCGEMVYLRKPVGGVISENRPGQPPSYVITESCYKHHIPEGPNPVSKRLEDDVQNHQFNTDGERKFP